MKGNMSKVVDVICNFQITTNMVLDILKPKPNMCVEELEQVRKQFDIAKYEPLNMQDLQSLDAPWYVVRYALLADEPLQRQHQGSSSSSITPQKPVLDSASSFASTQNAQGASPAQTSAQDHVQTPQPTPAITITPPLPVQVEQSSVNVNFNSNNATSVSSSAIVAQAPQTPTLVQQEQVVATTTNSNIAERRSTHVKYLNLKARVLKAILAKNKQIYIVKNKKSYSSRKSSTPGHHNHHHGHHHSASNNNHHHSNNNAADASVASSSINRRTSNGADLK